MSGRARFGAVTAAIGVKGRGYATRMGRPVRIARLPARLRLIVAAIGGRDWSWPQRAIRRTARRWRTAAVLRAADRQDRARGGLEQISERLNFGFAPKLPVLRQTEAAECGLVCLAMVASFHGLRTDPAAIRARHATSNRGLTLANIMKMAAPLGLDARAVRLELADLDKLRLPAVLHWNLDHFVVLRQVTRKGLRIHDPASGERLIPWMEVDKAFSGVALELWPSTAFAKGDQRKRIGLFDVTGRISGALGYLLNLVAIGVLLELLAILVPFFTQWAMDNVVALGDADLLTLLVVGMTIVLLLQLVFTTFRGWFITYTSSTFSLQWKSSVLGHLVRLPLAWFQTRHLGDIVSKFHATDAIAGALNTMFVESMFDGVMSFVTLGLMALYSWKLCLLAAAIMLLYGAFRALQVVPYRRALEAGIITGARLESHLMETIRGVRTVKLFLQEDGRKTEWLSLAVDATNAAVRTQRLKLSYRTANGLLGSMERVLIFWLGMKAVIEHEMTLGAIIAFIAYKDQFYSRVTSLIDNFIELRLLGTQVDRLADIVLTSTEQQYSATQPARAGALDWSVECVDLRFRYGEFEPMLLDGLNLKIAPGESVAIVGPSGCGKTTLINMMLGLIAPTGGQVLFGGHPIDRLGPTVVRQHVAAVTQDDILFAGSIAENIAAFEPAIDMARVSHCAELACMHADIERMPMGYNTLVGDMGSALSGGQRQRLHIARALYREPRVLVMDEATSHLDVATETRVSHHIAALGITRIIVAHRPQTIASADRVV
ncbi:peptidase domain-containing ABC transporter, partial [Bradyrhizobium sp.]|uniref:peptidase domain-containing ABC transporter n=1 Tax=Bradyrhizobium sp. TaxID=376 RepID=UPI003C6F0E08